MLRESGPGPVAGLSGKRSREPRKTPPEPAGSTAPAGGESRPRGRHAGKSDDWEKGGDRNRMGDCTGTAARFHGRPLAHEPNAGPQDHGRGDFCHPWAGVTPTSTPRDPCRPCDPCHPCRACHPCHLRPILLPPRKPTRSTPPASSAQAHWLASNDSPRRRRPWTGPARSPPTRPPLCRLPWSLTGNFGDEGDGKPPGGNRREAWR